jgi:hypothetical protein
MELIPVFPIISAMYPRYFVRGHVYRLRGRQLNGLSQANAYGDDAQMATNYLLVRLKRIGSDNVYFCRTSTIPPLLWLRERKLFTRTSTYHTWFPSAFTS